MFNNQNNFNNQGNYGSRFQMNNQNTLNTRMQGNFNQNNFSSNSQRHEQEFNSIMQTYAVLYDNSSPECIFKWPIFIESSNVS